MTAQAVSLPDDLTNLNQWVLWRFENRGGKPTKVPYQVNGARAKTETADTWNSYVAVLTSWRTSPQRYNGIGFVFGRCPTVSPHPTVCRKVWKRGKEENHAWRSRGPGSDGHLT